MTPPGGLNATLMLWRPDYPLLGPVPGGLAGFTAVPGAIWMLELLNQTFEVDTYTIVVVALLSAWAGVLTLHILSKTMLALVFVPGFIFGALVANYVFEEVGFYPTPDQETNVVVACTLGIVGALLVLLLVTRLTSAISGARVQRHQFRRY